MTFVAANKQGFTTISKFMAQKRMAADKKRQNEGELSNLTHPPSKKTSEKIFYCGALSFPLESAADVEVDAIDAVGVFGKIEAVDAAT